MSTERGPPMPSTPPMSWARHTSAPITFLDPYFVVAFYEWLLTQKIITHRVFENSWMVLRGCVWAGESFLSHDKWQIILLSEFFPQFTFNFLWVTLTQKIITHRVSKNSRMVLRGCVWAGESFLSHDKWQIILLSEFFMQVTFNILWVTLTQKIITHRVSKIHEWFWRDVYESGKVS